MEVRIKILDTYPKLAQLKTKSFDIFSIIFNYDNNQLNIEDIEKFILNKDEIMINLKDYSNTKNNFRKFIKFSLIKNSKNNSIILGISDLILLDGIRWYLLKEPKNENLSKESQITSSTSDNNLHNTSDTSNGNSLKLIYNVHNTNGNQAILNTSFKIRFSVKIIQNCKLPANHRKKNSEPPSLSNKFNKKTFYNSANKKTTTKQNIRNTNCIITKKKNSKKNLKKNSSLNSSNENIFDKDLLSDEEFNNIADAAASTLNSNLNQPRKLFCSDKFIKECIIPDSKKSISKHKSYCTKNLCKGKLISSNKTAEKEKNILLSPTIKLKNEIINDDLYPITSKTKDNKFSTCLNFYSSPSKKPEKKIKEYDNNINLTKSTKDIKDSEIIEDEIIDQNFKNNIKNDESLRYITNNILSNSENNSNKKLIKVNNSNESKIVKCNSESINPKKDLLNILMNNSDKNSDNNIKITENDEINNENNKTSDKKNDNSSINDNNSIIDNKMNEDLEYEKLKSNFLSLYIDDFYNKITEDMLVFELQLMTDKFFVLQSVHQKEYIKFYNEINNQKNIMNTLQYKLFLLTKKYNKLKTKILFDDYIANKKNNFKENIDNFIYSRKDILNKYEVSLWNKMTEKIPDENINDSIKNKITEIFLEIIYKNVNNLSKLSKKFYEEIKSKNTEIVDKIEKINRDKESDSKSTNTIIHKFNGIMHKCNNGNKLIYYKTKTFNNNDDKIYYKKKI